MGSITGKPGNISESTLRQGAFKVMFSLIVNNALSGWTVQSVSPLEAPKFPTIVLNSVSVDSENLSLDGTARDKPMTMSIEFYAKDEPYKKSKIDEGKDNVQTTLEGHIDELLTEGIILKNITDGEASLMVEGREKINAGLLEVELHFR